MAVTLKQRIRFILGGLEPRAWMTFEEIRNRLPGVSYLSIASTLTNMATVEQVRRRGKRGSYTYRSGTRPVTDAKRSGRRPRIRTGFQYLARLERTEGYGGGSGEGVSDKRNGNQELVYQAIARGHALVGEIMQATGLEEQTVRNHAKRLLDARRIERDYTPDDRHLVRYVVLKRRCLLAETWTGVRPSRFDDVTEIEVPF